MKTLHRIDFPAQIFILTASIVSLLFAPGLAFLCFYIGFGVWQPLMALLFALGPRPHAIRERKYYENVLLVLILVSLPWFSIYQQFDNDFMWYSLYTILPIGFIMAIWNITIAYREFQNNRREHHVWDIE